MSLNTQPVGFIGLGIMGQGMAARLITQKVAGTPERPLHIFNRTPSVSKEFVAAHPDAAIVVAETPADVVKAAGVTYSMLSTPEAASSVFNAKEGTLAGVSDGKSIVDCATLAETDHQMMSKAVIAAGGRYLEAPVSGSKGPAIQGALVFLCGGPESLFTEVADGLASMGKASHFLGEEVGVGTRAKLVVNSVMGTMLASFSEGINLAQAAGLAGDKMVEIFGQGACAAPMFALKGPKLVKEGGADHATNFPLKHAHKDMLLASQMAKKLGVYYGVNDEAEALYKRARDESEDLKDLDFSAVYEQIKRQKKE